MRRLGDDTPGLPEHLRVWPETTDQDELRRFYKARMAWSVDNDMPKLAVLIEYRNRLAVIRSVA